MFPFRSLECYPNARTASSTAFQTGAAGPNAQNHEEFQQGTGAP